MAKLYLKPGTDPRKVARTLSRKGFILKQQLPDGSFVLYKKIKKRKKRKRYEKDNLEAL